MNCCRFVYRLNDVIGLAGLVDMITIPIMLCSTGYLMMHVSTPQKFACI